jgi:hypothetical protein
MCYYYLKSVYNISVYIKDSVEITKIKFINICYYSQFIGKLIKILDDRYFSTYVLLHIF